MKTARMRGLDEPNMSDTTLLVTVEDLINMAIGPAEGNVVDFKVIQTILHILARQMRLLEQKVVMEVGPLPPPTKLRPPKAKDTSTSESTSSSGKRGAKGRKTDIGDIKEEDGRGSDEERGQDKAKRKGKGKESSSDDDRGGRYEDRGGRDAERGGRDADGGSSDTERDGIDAEKGGRVSIKGGKGSKDADKGGKDAGKGGKGSGKGKDADAEKDKGKDKAGKADQKDKAGKGKDKDQDKGQSKMDKEKGEKDKDSKKKDKKAEEAAEKEKREKDEKGGGKGGKDSKKGGKGGQEDTETRRGIGIKEVTSQNKEKLLVVEKGPTTRGKSDRGRQSIEVVTQSQFALLEAAVDALRDKTLPPPPPTLPGNEKLRSELAAGSATLTDAMQAMQVAARVQAAEQAIGRLGGLLTALAGAGALPPSAGAFDDDDDDDEDDAYAPHSRPSTTSRKSVMIKTSKVAVSKRQSVATTASAGGLGAASAGGLGAASTTYGGRPSIATGGRASIASRASMGAPLVTQADMSDAITNMRQELMKNMQAMATRVQTSADSAANVAKSVAEKLDTALRLNNRVSTLHSLVDDYAEQLAGFDAGLTTQMMSFQEQMALMRKDLGAGLAQLENANNNAETAAVMELTERYQLLVADLEHTLLAHQALTTFQQQLSLDFRSLYECVEMLREQKADRDEVLDGLRDKADNERLAGLLREEDFKLSCTELELRLELCHDKFRKQDLVWVTAIKDLTHVVQTKAELMDLLKTRDETTDQLQYIHDMIKKLALILGEPKAAMLTRQLARNAACGACLVPALMDPEDAVSGKPPALPAARGAPVGAEAPCEADWKPPQPPELRTHTCHRWVGGSHTLLAAGAREPPRAPPPPAATRKFVGPGMDGRLYMMETELEPCVECNPLPADGGAGDRAPLGVLYGGVDVVGLEDDGACACYPERARADQG